MRRREAMVRLGLGSAGVALFPRDLVAGPQASGPDIKPGDIAELALQLRRAPRNKAFDVASSAIRAGADYKTILGAVFLGGIHDVQPRPVGGRLHCVMMVESAFDLAETATPEQAWMAALWNLDYFKQSQEEDDRAGGWVLPPRPDIETLDEPRARRAFVQAMNAWDAPAADRALVALLPHHDRESIFEILWPYAGRCIEYLGHKIVFGAQVERVLRRIEWRHAEPVLRALVYGLLGYHGDPLTAVYDSSVALAPTLRDGWETRGKPQAGSSLRLLTTLRESSPAGAQRHVVSLLDDNVAPASIWDGLRLFASELFLRRLDSDPLTGEAIRAVHPVTELHAFGHAFRTTTSAATLRLLMLQATGWVVAMRDGLLERKAITMKGPGIDVLGDGEDHAAVETSLDTVLKSNSPATVSRYLARHGDQGARYLRRLREAVFVNAVESHQYKYLAALEEEVRLAQPSLRARLLAPAIPYQPTTSEPANDFRDRALHALRKS